MNRRRPASFELKLTSDEAQSQTVCLPLDATQVSSDRTRPRHLVPEDQLHAAAVDAGSIGPLKTRWTTVPALGFPDVLESFDVKL